ncbi:Exonuclease RNase T/DNA polymerase III [Arabidopsis thaliana x Arabidopsis arenosa]|uniref:Exonuclease RNase T/DNA polymerase III n=1 Tax=Arabidopsis thaliana x Arabidopsis arenosa TaxID=1240361 RepID=A0A8T2BPT1_9BRAS|nr:Exonuclease RNase T/DNA polymerase III [Arabidopsis thaliana x Arabidopsis arenosa]
MASTLSGDERSEIAFFDLETAVPTKSGQPFAILEFGAILVCPRKLVELYSYSTLVRPTDLSLISTLTKRRSGITRDGVLSAPTFSEIADEVYDILHGRIWAGHNIKRFDCVRIRDAFAEIGLSPPEPKATIDSLSLLSQKFGKRAGDMKMASLATYFGLGDQAHRSLDDVRMNLEVVKYCATVLFLESSVPDILTDMSWFSPRKSPRTRRSNEKSVRDGVRESSTSSSSSPKTDPSLSSVDSTIVKNHPIVSLLTECSESDTSSCEIDPSDITTLISKLHIGTLQTDAADEAKTVRQQDESPPSPDPDAKDESFLGVNEVSVSSIRASLIPFSRGSLRMKLFHNDTPLHLCWYSLKIRFGISRKFLDHAGHPRLNIVVDIPPDLCKILDAADAAAHNLPIDSSTNSDWRPTVIRKEGFANYPTARLQISSESNGDDVRCGTQVYQKEEPLGTNQKLDFSSDNFEKLESALLPGTLVDAFFALEPYDYQQKAGIRLAARKLVIHWTK